MSEITLTDNLTQNALLGTTYSNPICLTDDCKSFCAADINIEPAMKIDSGRKYVKYTARPSTERLA